MYNMPLFSRLARLLQFSVMVYVVVAIVYTTSHFVLSPLYSGIFALLSGVKGQAPSGLSWTSIFSGSYALSTHQNSPIDKVAGKNRLSLETSTLSKEVISWRLSEFTANQMGLEYSNLDPILMSEDLFLSKAFSQSMYPSKIVPFFYRAVGEFDKEDITLTTLVTSNRFKVFSQLVEIYNGASIAIIILSDLHLMPLTRSNLCNDPHQVYGSGCRQPFCHPARTIHILALNVCPR